MKKISMRHFTIDTPSKFWATPFGYHIHKGVIGLILMIVGLIIILNDLNLGAIIFALGLGIVIMDTIGHIYTNWHKTIVFIEKHKGLTYKKGGYKKKEVNNLGH
ncbi:hypothetical protein M1349_02760 [Patescibacteria group bacterium]|nr:hypothetical protein [Patescibacteria group bacterium]